MAYDLVVYTGPGWSAPRANEGIGGSNTGNIITVITILGVVVVGGGGVNVIFPGAVYSRGS